MIVPAIVLPQILYRRTSGTWLAPLAPLLRVLACWPSPLVAALGFFQSLIELTDDEQQSRGAAHSRREYRSADLRRHRRGTDRRGRPQADPVRGGVRRQGRPGGDDAAPQHRRHPADATLEQLRQLVINEQYSRIPVYEGSIDQIIGFVHVRDMFELDEDERATPQRARIDAAHPLRARKPSRSTI